MQKSRQSIAKRHKTTKQMLKDWRRCLSPSDHLLFYFRACMLMWWCSGTHLSDVRGRADKQRASESPPPPQLWGMGCAWWIVFSRQRVCVHCSHKLRLNDSLYRSSPCPGGGKWEGYELCPPTALLKCCTGIRELWWRSLVEEIGGNRPRKWLNVCLLWRKKRMNDV